MITKMRKSKGKRHTEGKEAGRKNEKKLTKE